MDVLSESMTTQDRQLIQNLKAGLTPASHESPPRAPRLRDPETTPAEALARLKNNNIAIAENTRLRIAREGERHKATIEDIIAAHQAETAGIKSMQADGLQAIDDEITALNAEIERLRTERAALQIRKTDVEKANAAALNELAGEQRHRIEELNSQHAQTLADLKSALAMAEAALAAGAAEV